MVEKYTELSYIYQEMYERNLKNLKENNFLFDPKLEEDDSEFCFAVFCENIEYKMHEELGNIIKSFPENFKEKMVFYDIDGDAKLHFTLLQILGFNFRGNIISEDYKKIMTDILDVSFEIRYRHLIPVKSGFILCGYPSIDVNELREKIRKKLRDSSLRFEEPYYNNIVHSTFIRFKQELSQNERDYLLFSLEKYLNFDFGIAKISKFSISRIGWKLSRIK